MTYDAYKKRMAYNNHPIHECLEQVMPYIKSGRASFFQKFTCDKCRKRMTMDVPNKFFTLGTCECGHVTDLRLRGCNYLLVTSDQSVLTSKH
jgi:hypothetical protein